MKRQLTFLLASIMLFSLSGCCIPIDRILPQENTEAAETEQEMVNTQAPETIPISAEPETEPTAPPTTKPVETEPVATNDDSYLLDITRLNLPIFDGPGYDNQVVEVVYKQGLYTITQEKVVEGTRWGKLKSGLGWVDLDEAKRTVSAAVSYTHSSLTSHYPIVDRVYLGGTMDVYIFVNKRATNFEVVQVDDCWSSPYVSSVKAEVGTVNPGEAVMLTFNIYGDAQTSNIGIRFTDSNGFERVFFITDNGRNNMLSLVEA